MDRRKTLEELDGQQWGDPTYPSSLVIRCHALRRKPINELTTEDLRLLVGQQIGLEYILPDALDVLEINALASGDYYPGDLLKAVLSIAHSYWSSHPELLARLDSILTQLERADEVLEEPIVKALAAFRRVRNSRR